ncbi:MAG: ketosamine-3-kinase [Bacteroidetes bacterium]|nr:MAG: ketosamine-3-kinase [Bacteroidota bacterium]
MNKLHEELFLDILEKNRGVKGRIISTRTLSGGDINQAAKVETGEGLWFAKWNSADAFPGMFEAEAKGLELLRRAGEVFVPAVVGFGEMQNESMLVLEYVDSKRENPGFWHDFGRSLAAMHKHTEAYFGLDHHNYIGSLPQYNHKHDSWVDFFISCRLEEQIKMARNKGRIDKSTINQFERLYARLNDFFPQEKPSLLHGDLWSGNFMTSHKGDACIIDPAVYYGHRLMDLGMTKLFGGFSPELYDAYHNEFPLESNWREAIEIANLYPLMVHVNLFGGGYMGSVSSVLRKF